MAYFAPYIDGSGLHMPTYEDRLEDLVTAYRSIFGIDSELSESVPEDEDSALSSLAYLADMSAFWVKESDGTWAESTSDALALLGLIG